MLAKKEVDDRDLTEDAAYAYFKIVSILGMLSLEHLGHIPLLSTTQTDPAILLSLLSFTDPKDLWTCPKAHALALQILSQNESQLRSQGFIGGYILTDYLRPLFSKSNPSGITSRGRKSINPDPRPSYDTSRSDPASKPWKFKYISAITIFNWVVTNAEVGVHFTPLSFRKF
jgi:hypothetical protein